MMTPALRDRFSLMSALKPHRLWNLLCVKGAEVLSRLRKEPFLLGSPAYIHIEPTSVCNLKCPECPTGLGLLSRPQGYLTPEAYERMLGKLARNAFYLTLYFQGEPLLHPGFTDLVRRAKEYRLYVVTSTNAQCVNQERARHLVRSGLDRLIISFDGPNRQTYENYRIGGDWDRVKSAVVELRKARDENNGHGPLLVLQCLIMRGNETQQRRVRELAATLGADKVEFKTMQLMRTHQRSDLLPLNQKHARYRWTENQVYELKCQQKTACSRIFTSCVVCWDGNVVPCCYDKDADNILGNVITQNREQIWKGSLRKAFVRRVLKTRTSVEMCMNCEE